MVRPTLMNTDHPTTTTTTPIQNGNGHIVIQKEIENSSSTTQNGNCNNVEKYGIIMNEKDNCSPSQCNNTCGDGGTLSTLPEDISIGSNSRTTSTSEESSLCGSEKSNGIIGGSSGSESCINYVSRRKSSSTFDNYQSLTQKIQGRVESGNPFFSLEFFPPRTKSGAVNLLARLDRLRQGGPLFCDITWHPAGNPSGDSETSSLTIAAASLNYSGLNTMLHMTCSEQSRDDINRNLARAKEVGIRNILALRGDKSDENQRSELCYAVELVRHIRKEYGEYFVIGVAGYPTGHPEALDYNEDLQRLKEKVDAGAEFIITQLFFKPEVFIKFVEDCRRIGIRVPIIPGVMPIQSFESLRHMVKLSKLEVPQEILDILKPLKNNDEAIRNFGIHQAVDMIKVLFNSGMAPGIHFYTLNREVAVISIAKQLGLWSHQPQRPLPWKVVPSHKRCQEEIRPIFWSSRPNAYIHRTQHWDEFPNGRWGSSESPAFGDLKDYYLFYLKSKSPKEELLSMWGKKLEREEDVWNVFYNYLTGHLNENGVKVTRIPWNDAELSAETYAISEHLVAMNKRGVLTINSQPNVNGASSTHPIHGWGQPGGYVYQKAYLEFFTCEKNVNVLKNILPQYPQINYHIISKNGKYNYSNANCNRPIAVTWGVFPGREIIQPTVVDSESYLVWKDEAFALWNEQWAKLYDDDDTNSSQVIHNIANNYYLVNLVDNDYPKESCLWEVIEKMLAQADISSNFV